MKKVLFSFLCSAFLLSESAFALIQYGQSNDDILVDYTGSGNAAEYSVAKVGGCSCVYLGNGWFVTAEHVKVYKDTSYVYQNGSAAQVSYVDTTFSSTHNNVDIELFYVQDTSALTYLTSVSLDGSVCAKIAKNSNVLMVGNGYGRSDSSALTDTVVEWSSTSMAVRSADTKVGLLNTSAGFDYFMTFAYANNTTSNVAVADRDSGSGMFYYYNNQYYLVGLNVAIGAPSTAEARTSVFGTTTTNSSYSFSLDLEAYSADILSIISSAPIPEASEYAAIFGLIALIATFALRRKR